MVIADEESESFIENWPFTSLGEAMKYKLQH
jgi:hypothetical protein